MDLYRLNNMVTVDPIGTVQGAEDEYHTRVRGIADYVISRGSVRVILIAGPSGSGKTTSANLIKDAIIERGRNTIVVSLDDFYRDASDPDYPKLENGEQDYECPESLRLDEIADTLAAISRGEAFDLPKYDFKVGGRVALNHHEPMPDGCVIIEGIEFKKVSFSYNEKKAINNISLKINKNEKIAIVGENGAGKTTFIKLLLRLYDPTEGEILLNNIDYKEYNSSDIRNQFVTVFQDYQIYALSIAENILLRKCNNSDDEKIVIDALKKVGLYDKVMQLEKGIRTICTTEFDKDGIEFSGGEKQKFVIARIFASNAPILLLDEPNSALDPIAERHIFDEIFNYSINKTLIFISHRFSTTILSDKIYLFSNGEIIEQGSHHELMSIQNGKYKEMFNTQAFEYLNRGEHNEEN